MSTEAHSINAENQARLRNTNQKYENSTNKFGTFLNDKGELPRLSILDNYKQIMRIMTNSYIKGNEYQQKFGNRLDVENDEEYIKYKDEETNIKKMGTILKGLNHPVVKKNKISGHF
jgi:hypothetical protein